MCDQDSINDMFEAAGRGAVSRRHFAALSLGTGLAMALPRAANAVAVTEAEVEIRTPDGTADAYFVHPSNGAAPGVAMWPDIRGLRPTMRVLAKRLAESGYAVLVPNPYYRIAKESGLPDGAAFFTDEATQKKMFGMMATLTAAVQTTDSEALIAYLDAQPAVDKKRKLGVAGYCMGGATAMRFASAAPDRVGAGASFHGGRLVTETPDSPHLLVPHLKAQFLFAIAENDDQQQPDAKNVLRAAFDQAKVPAEIEVYQGTKHGWCSLDSPIYNEAQAEKAWQRMLVLFKAALA